MIEVNMCGVPLDPTSMKFSIMLGTGKEIHILA
jgi:hypothetical protein